MADKEALWQEFFKVAQAITQKNMPTADKGLAITQFGLHYRARELYGILIQQYGPQIMGGPFAGTDLGPHGEYMSACLARLLGVYEYPLRQAITAAIARTYDTLINIGAGEGYYAIGMARAMPNLRVIAADTSTDMQKACAALAVLNGVSDRITLCGELNAADLATHIKGRTLIICDIEGAEEQLLDPATCPALLQTDLIIELHDVCRDGISQSLAAAYADTHNIQMIETYAAAPPLPAFADGLPEIDRFLLTYEGRAGKTPWGVFMRR